MTTKKDILDWIQSVWLIKGANSMGVSESWYNPLYLMKHCFEEEELNQLSEEEVIRLYCYARFLLKNN